MIETDIRASIDNVDHAKKQKDLSSHLQDNVDHAKKHTSYLSFFLHGQNFWRKKFTPAKKNLHGHVRGVRDKYEVCVEILICLDGF